MSVAQVVAPAAHRGVWDLAALYTVVATCLAHNLDPLTYLADVLTRLDSRAAESVDTLLPHNWARAPVKTLSDAAGWTVYRATRGTVVS